MKEAFRALDEKVARLGKRMSALEEGGDEVGSSSSEQNYEREWRWGSGSWWFTAPLVKGARVNARYRRKISRLVKQMAKNGFQEPGGSLGGSWYGPESPGPWAVVLVGLSIQGVFM